MNSYPRQPRHAQRRAAVGLKQHVLLRKGRAILRRGRAHVGLAFERIPRNARHAGAKRDGRLLAREGIIADFALDHREILVVKAVAPFAFGQLVVIAVG